MEKLLLFWVVIFSAMSLSHVITESSRSYHADAVSKLFIAQCDEFLLRIDSLESAVINHRNIEESYLDLRRKFKTVETLFSYYLEDEYTLYINGAPLPKLEPNVPEVNVLSPVGMQVIDEIIADYTSASEEELVAMLSQLEKSLKKSLKILRAIKIYDRHILEAVRSELVRITSLSLSGFDTPGTALFIHDCETVLDNVAVLLSGYKPQMNNDQLEIFNLLQQALNTLSNTENQHDLDYAHFIREYIDPLYGLILDFHLDSGIEHAREVSNQLSPLNYYSRHLFSDDLLHLPVFSRIDRKEYTPDRIALGELLFFDPILSHDLSLSCASCHKPSKAFTDGKRSSLTSDGDMVMRNAPTLINSIYTTKYFHDLRASKPDLQMDHVVYNEREFNIDYVEIAKRLKLSTKYTKRYSEA